ncbi:MAG: SpoIVB peptidase [Lachnospiraceae bacterium]|jgi:stage IV sporulation protein B|nr:SpoIVB peptidase [Lachnospiraceae bacterium]
MSRRIWYRRILYMVLIVGCIYTGFVIYSYIDRIIPDKIHIVVDEEEEFNFQLPIEAKIESDNAEVSFTNASNIPSNQITVNLNEAFSLKSKKTGNYQIQMKLFGFLPIKSIDVSVIEQTQVIPCGFPVGIYLETDGILVVGSAKVVDLHGTIMEPAYMVVKSGDYIKKINGETVNSKEEMIKKVKDSGGKEMILTIRRNEEEMNVKITPVETEPEEYKLGIWVRDDAQGIGTLTYLTAQGEFGGLGHGVSDVDTGMLLEACGGKLYEARILSIIKGEAGTPGGLSGVINYNEKAVLGEITKNTSQGIFGKASFELRNIVGSEAMDIGLRQEVKLGEAYVRCKIEGEMKDYKILITKIDNSSHNLNKGMEIKIVDEELLEKTNGIVQGMSGSPIIQNGKLIGAVTHVFVQDSTKGYGIFIENMLSSSEDK